MTINELTCDQCGKNRVSKPGDGMDMYSVELPRVFVGFPHNASLTDQHRATHLDFCTIRCLKAWAEHQLSQMAALEPDEPLEPPTGGWPKSIEPPLA